MTTSLPAGIFVKVGRRSVFIDLLGVISLIFSRSQYEAKVLIFQVAESRSDAMKILIVGPEGSPYAHGLFM